MGCALEISGHALQGRSAISFYVYYLKIAISECEQVAIHDGSSSMKAVRLESVGNLFLCEVEKPVAGPGELLVRIEVCGICGTDRHLFLGEFPSKPPVTLGHEF